MTDEYNESKHKELNYPKYSIITPMYNSFNLMSRYFQSLDNQRYKNFEIIIIDDNSSDDSYLQVKEYASKSPLHISVLKTEKNMGPGHARNIGMKAAKGEWITFIDNDDWVDKDLLYKVDTIICQNEINCVVYDYYISNGTKNRVAHSMYTDKDGVISITECIATVRNHSVAKFYKRDKCLKNNIKYPEIRRCEDVAFVCRAIDACGSVYYLREPLYYYYQRPTSLSNNLTMDETDMLTAFNILEEELGNKYPEELREKSVPDLLYGILLMMCKSGKANEKIISYIDAYEKKYPEWWKCEIIQHLGYAKKTFLNAAKIRNVFLMKQYAKVHDFMIGQTVRKLDGRLS